ncbi:tRNA lysidine(34) synthetase TilS [Propionivibrio sp.]|uniref:tRNA lysidine(34) synthetase TilS n=1 Tax=Propionivibrio sp. TaxID=2212460 RepID=UPI00263568FF|nr:tRNA lysidine(34) synthetase TilS [Propionivibrio sp.]
MAALKSKCCADRCAVGEASATDSLATILSAFIAAQLAANPGRSRLCVGLSGGRDSVVLLHALSCLRLSTGSAFTLSALHVHHGISPDADVWAGFCAEFCQCCTVPLSIVRVDVPRASGEGLESAARRLRHAVFADCAADWLALAHHRDDQAETVLLNLLRGAGMAGAAGMLAERPQGHGPILVRPLLEVPRALIEDYAVAQGLRWIDDESNDDTHFRRNFLRREVMPRLEEKFSGAQKSLARCAGHFAEGALLLDDLAAIDCAALATPAGRIGLAAFNALSPPRARNLLRFAWLAAGFRAPDTRWINEALRQLATADSFSETCVATVDGVLHVYRGELHILGHGPDAPGTARPWAGESELPWAGGRLRFVSGTGSGIRRSLFVDGEVVVRPRQGGEHLQPDARRPRRSLRKLFQEAAIPPWERTRLPFLWIGGRLAWVGGLGVEAAFACAPGEAGIVPVWEPGYPSASLC